VFRTKICGLTRPEDVRAAVAAGAEALGFNFSPQSPRGLTLTQALPLAALVPPHVQKIGVFVNAPLADICAIAAQLPLDGIQLHGDEPPETLTALMSQPGCEQTFLIRAWRWSPDAPARLAAYLARCAELSTRPQAILVDGFHPSAYGGTGVTADWSALANWHATPDRPPLILAGGLKPDNVTAAIRAVRPAAVDTASGVESAPGIKDHEKMSLFIAAARAALAEVS